MISDDLIKSMRYVGFDDVTEFLRSKTSVPSSFGSALDRAQNGTMGPPDAYGQHLSMEMRMLRNAAVIRCVDALERYQSIRFVDVRAIRRFAQKAGIAEGLAVVEAMRAYTEWETVSKERGLAEVYSWMRTRQPSLPMPSHTEETVAQAFRTGKALTARNKASAILADAHLALGCWVAIWNKRGGRGPST